MKAAAREGGAFRHPGGVTPLSGFTGGSIFCGETAAVPSATRPRKLHIPHPAASGRSRPLRCSSSPNSKRSAGLLFGPVSVLPEKSMQKRGAGRGNSADARKGVSLHFTYFRYTGGQGTPFGRRPHKLHIPRFRASAKTRPFRCSSFPKHKRFAGLCFGSLVLSCSRPLNI